MNRLFKCFCGALFIIAVSLFLSSCSRKGDDPVDSPQTQKKAGGTKSGLYLGITGFNKTIYYYPIGLLNTDTKAGFDAFIDGLQQEHMTLLYYSVKQSVRTLQNAYYPKDLFSASIVTFTDGEDDGSVYYEKYPGDDEEYLQDVNALLNTEQVAGVPLSAWTIGLQSADASDSKLFLEHLQKLSKPESNGVRVTKMADVNKSFERIAKELNQSLNVYNISIRMVGKSNGTQVRFTLDNVSSADKSEKYVEGTFDMYKSSLYDVTYHGFTCSSGESVEGKESDGLITFRFENICMDDGVEIDSNQFKQWGWNKSTNSWHPYSEFDPAQDSFVEKVKKSAVVLLNLDCTTSLSSGSVDLFPTLKAYAKSFISTLCEYTIDKTAVASVSLNKSELHLQVGSSETLNANVLPITAINKSVTWSSSDSSIATVSPSGKVTAQKKGTSIITVTTEEGSKIAQCLVTVINKEDIANAVDLGLSVKWAAWNVGASKPEEYGNYFAWGETLPKSDYSWSSYKWGDGESLTKYNTESNYGTVDNKTVLEPADDVAYVSWGGKWRMPTRAEFDELMYSCTFTWTTQNGMNGCAVTSKNGNSIFLPAGAGIDGTSVNENNLGVRCQYWSSSLYDGDSVGAWRLVFSLAHSSTHATYRYAGQTVRPVYGDAPVPVSSVNLNKSSLDLHVGECYTLKPTVLPGNASIKTVLWSSDNATVASVDINGSVTGNSAGTTTICATTVDGRMTAKCIVTVGAPDAIDLGLSVKWASFNVGATKPEEYGDYFAWGETQPKSEYSWSTYKFGTNSTGPFSKYNSEDNKTVLEAEDDAAHVVFGEKWRTPTDNEWDELISKCSWTWTSRNGVNGYEVKASNGNCIFLPAAHYRMIGDNYNYSLGNDGFYWSSYVCSSFAEMGVVFHSSSVTGNGASPRYIGYSVRPVSE